MKDFLNEIDNFTKDFESKFVDYFVSLILSHNEIYLEDVEDVARFIYRDAFRPEEPFVSQEKDFFEDLNKNSAFISLIISKSMLFFLKNYIKVPGHNQQDELITYLENYEENFENTINDKCKVKENYISFGSNDGFVIGNSICDIFKKLKDNDEEITFFNLYEGLPISSKATIIDIDFDNDEVVFRYEKIQEIVMKMEGVAYILKDEHFSKYIKADIVYHDFYDSTVTLKNFIYLLNMPASEREFIRVPPNIPAKVNLSERKDIRTEGKLFDLSINGLGVISETNHGLYVGAKVDINFELYSYEKEMHDDVVAYGEILDIIPYEDSYRYCVLIYPRGDAAEVIKKYVKSREQEIMKSLNFRLLA